MLTSVSCLTTYPHTRLLHSQTLGSSLILCCPSFCMYNPSFCPASRTHPGSVLGSSWPPPLTRLIHGHGSAVVSSTSPVPFLPVLSPVKCWPLISSRPPLLSPPFETPVKHMLEFWKLVGLLAAVSETSPPVPWLSVYISGWAIRHFSLWSLRCFQWMGSNLELFHA